MSNYTDRELAEAIYDVRDRVTRIEEKLNRTEKLEDKVEATENLAIQAMAKGMENEKKIDDIIQNDRWKWGFIITLGIMVVGKFFGL